MKKSNGSSNQQEMFKTKIVAAKPGSGKLFEEEADPARPPGPGLHPRFAGGTLGVDRFGVTA